MRFFIIRSSHISLVALRPAARADTGSCRECSPHPGQVMPGM